MHLNSPFNLIRSRVKIVILNQVDFDNLAKPDNYYGLKRILFSPNSIQLF